MSTGGVWFSRHANERGHVLLLHADGSHEDGATVDAGAGLDGDSEPSVLGQARVEEFDGHVRVVELNVGSGLWFALVDSSRDDVPALTLAAFADDRRPAGAVLGARECAQRGIRAGEQVASVRWLVGSGVVHQVEVMPQWRRKGMATRVLLAAELVRASHGWPRLHGGEDLTELGALLTGRLGERFGARIDAQRSWAPPQPS